MIRLAASLGLALCVGTAALTAPAAAQESYPNRPVTLVVAFAAGGTSDIIARLFANKLSEYAGTSFVVEDIPGAACMTGTERVAHAAPDGYTIYVASSTPFATNPNFYHHLRYTLDDFAPITQIGRVPLAMDVRKEFPPSSVKEFVDYARKQPDGVTIATPGRGSVGEIINGMARGILDIKITDISYPGSTPAVADLMKGVVDSYFDAISSTVPLYKAGTFKILAVTGQKRSPAAPEVPTLLELGYKDFMLENVYTVLAPKGTPRPIVDKLNALLRRAMSDPAFRDSLLGQGIVPEPSTPEGTKDLIQQDYQWNATMVQRFNIKAID
ncbi:MAG TPA: tripartite tricarboxylate transporter substrate binding protein [Xanthobacteraceae bacterium]|jgi:tripartite-type tricarboxylate transporter receptor subunit TctC|nr:tripartite tricarboxylate transporter substrate binding protein [Xanthobacteraceae bacterium]